MTFSSAALEDAVPSHTSAEIAGNAIQAVSKGAALLHFLEAVRQGHLFIDRKARLVTCTPRALLILQAFDPTLRCRSSIRQLFRALLIADPSLRGQFVARLREAWIEERRIEIEITTDHRVIEIEIHPVVEQGWAITLDDISLRRTAEANAARLARLDPLTELPNRLLLRERVDEALSRLARTGEPFSLLLIDLDRFKPVNDTLGHPVGDRLLQKVAERLLATVRPTDTVARLGGDEFIVLQTATVSASAAETLARRVVDLIGRTYVVDGNLLTIGASVGIARAPQDASAVDSLLKCADLALYRAKVDGRSTFRFFEPEMDRRMQARRRLELDMRQALARREFQLHYQPQLNLVANALVGCEALIRWMHPAQGQISPADFIPLAEEIGLIVPIGEWVIRQACRDAMSWPVPLSVAVNVSPAQFKSERLIETVVSALAYAGLPASRLEIEITEGVLLQENERTLATLHRLRDLGIRVSMDDFGTGYSSLSYLRSFPFDKIKIDRSFVTGMADSPDGTAIIRAISGLGASLGMTTVAEGVETPEQLRRIREEGCTDVQGYLVSRPVPAAELLKLLSAIEHCPPQAPPR